MYCRRVVRNFLGQGSFLKISAKIRIFSRLWNYMLTLQWVLSRFCSVTVIVLIYNKISPYMHHHGWRRTNICILTFLEASKTHFWCSLKVNIKNRILCHEHEGCEMGIPLSCRQLVHGGPFFLKQISHSNTKYFITSIHATWTYSYKKRKAFLILMTLWTAAFVNTTPT